MGWKVVDCEPSCAEAEDLGDAEEHAVEEDAERERVSVSSGSMWS